MTSKTEEGNSLNGTKLKEEDIEKFFSQITESTPYDQIDFMYRKLISTAVQQQSEINNPLIGKYGKYINLNYQSKDDHLSTIPMMLISYGQYEECKELIKSKPISKFDPNILDGQQENCLFKLIKTSNERGKIEMMTSLLTFQININHQNSKGNSALSLSLSQGNSEISKKILSDYNPDTSIIIKDTLDNLLHIAIKGKNPYCLDLVIKSISNEDFALMKDQKNIEGDTPIQLATKTNSIPMIKLLNGNGGKKSITINGGNNGNNSNFDIDLCSPLELLCQLKEDNSSEIIAKLKENYYLNNWNKIYVTIIDEIKSNKEFNYEIINQIFSFFSTEEDSIIKTNQITPLNKLISSFKVLDLSSMISVLKNYLNAITKESNVNEIYLFYVNGSLMIIDSLLNLQQANAVEGIINQLSFYMSNYQYSAPNSNQEKIICAYLSYKELFTKDINWSEVLELYLCYYNLSTGNFDKAKKNLQLFKKEYTLSFQTKGNYLLYNSLKHFYNVLKVKLDYHNNTTFKCFKHLNSLIGNYNDIYSNLFYFNSIGILNLKQKKYAYAEYCFKVCEQFIKKNEMITYHFLNSVLYNISLCYFFTKKYGKCYKILSELKTINFMSSNPYLFYRFGLCCMERDQQDNKQNGQKIISNDEIKQFLFYSEGENQSKFRGAVLVNSTPTNVKNNTDVNEYIVEAISSFKQCLLIIQGKTMYKKDIDSLQDLYYKEDNSSSNEILSVQEKSTQYHQIYSSVYLNLLFCLLRNRDYTEVIHFGLEYENNEQSINMKESYIIDNYLIEAYLRMNNTEKALEILSNNNFNYNSNEFKGTFFNSGNQLLYNEVNFKLVLYINLLKINFMKENMPEVEKGIMAILSLVKLPEKNDIPPFIANILIYYFIIKGQQETAYHLIKYHRLPNNEFAKEKV